MTEKLSNKDKRDLVLQAGMQLLPYVGGPMATLYFGSKQEKRFKRLESFYNELSQEIEGMRDSIKSIEEQDSSALEAILEQLHEKVETEPTFEKRLFFKNYFKSTLISPISNNYDERKYFLDALADMSALECELLALIKKQPRQVQIASINKPGVDQYAIVGAIGRLKSRGFLSAATGAVFSIGGSTDNTLQEMVVVSSYGNLFCSFCLNT
ncbi:hypothetical protein [Vibrio coralliilyticus]|uniref:hypothetical protein n=1 Tax=Vibrio coralliilyticus TaxID=190893 RepID=UPI000C170728|nr:hypothetical protein [Vibrio coralliilyticus]